MAHIVEFTVDRLAGSSQSYSQRLNRDVNIFFGKNGSGKTSLLKILHSAMSMDARILGTVPFHTAAVKVYSINYNRIITERITKKRVRPAVTEAHEDPELTSTVDEYQQLRLLDAGYANPRSSMHWLLSTKIKPTYWAHQYLPISRLYSTTVSPLLPRQATYSEEELDLRFAESLQGLWSGYAAGVSKAVREAQETGLAKILKAVLSRSINKKNVAKPITAQRAFGRVSAFLKRQPEFKKILGSSQSFERRYNGDLQLQSVVRDIDEVEQKIELATSPQDRFKELVQAMFIGKKAMTLDEKGIQVELGKKKIGLPTLSSGEKQLLLIFVATLAAAENTIIIDEPELSMHVDWQTNLVKSMRLLNPNAQIIIATHSPEVMADVPDSKIFRI